MSLELILGALVSLVFLLAILLFVYFYLKRPEEEKGKEIVAEGNETLSEPTSQDPRDLLSLTKKVQDPSLSNEELRKVLRLVLKYHSKINNFDDYVDLIIAMCTHPKTNKDTIISFDKKLIKFNPAYKVDIGNTVTKGLSARA